MFPITGFLLQQKSIKFLQATAKGKKLTKYPVSVSLPSRQEVYNSRDKKYTIPNIRKDAIND